MKNVSCHKMKTNLAVVPMSNNNKSVPGTKEYCIQA